MQSKVVSCVFLGYPPAHKSYKLFNLDNSKVFITRDVIFHEHIFSYKVFSQSSQFILENNPTIHVRSNPHIEDLTHEPALSPKCALPTDSHCAEPPLPTQSDSTFLLRKSSRTFHPPVWHKDYVIASNCETS